jgi:small GTP-binding protein
VTKELVVALAGNPNSGKTTLFNSLTGAHQYVGNWPGVTVEKREGVISHRGYRIRVVDLPGVYGLTARSPDELVARNFILEGKPDVVVDVLDASNLERNLYLTIQLLELETRLVIALNMMDAARALGYEIDTGRLSQELGVPVVPMVATHHQGQESLLDTVVSLAESETSPDKFRLYYGEELEGHIAELEAEIKREAETARQAPPRWLALKLLENDREVAERIGVKA